MSSIFCCRIARTDSPPLPGSASFQSPRSPSSVSVTYVDDNSLHPAVPGSIGDAEALQEIFASLSPVRGYRLVSRTPNALPSFEQQRVCPSSAKPSLHPLSTLTKKIQKRLSESGLSKQSSRKSKSALRDEHHEMIHYDASRSTSRASGLGDILASRSVSKGGYDPDATGIKTPSERQPSAGSIQISPKYLTKVLRSLENSPKDSKHGSSKSANATRTHTAKYNDTPENSVEDVDDSNIRFGDRRLRALSSPTPDPATSHRKSFSAALEFGSQESPRDAIQRLGGAMGSCHTVKSRTHLPEKTDSLHRTKDREPWHLSFSAPVRGSSIGKNTGHQRSPLRLTTENIPKPDAGNNLCAENPSEVKQQHSSVFFDNDDSLLGAIGTYLNQQSPRKAAQGPGVNEKLQESFITNIQNSRISSHPLLKERRSTGKIAIGHHSDARGTQQQSDSRDHLSSESERQSLHLFNMQISQRLASTSVSNVISPSLSRAESMNKRLHTGNSSRLKLSSIDGPSFVTAKHPVKPSLATSKAASVGELSQQREMRPDLSPDDASSFYVSQQDSLPGSRGKAVSVEGVPESSDVQFVPPRIDIDDYLRDLKRYQSEGDLTNADQRSWLRPDTRATMRSSTNSFRVRELAASDQRFDEDKFRKAKSPKASKFVEDFTSQDGKADSLHPCNGGHRSPTQSVNNTGPRLSQELRSQKKGQGGRGRADSGASRRTSDGWLSGGRRQGYGYEFVEPADEDTKRIEQTIDEVDRQGCEEGDESAASLWERALKTAQDTRQLGVPRSSFGSSLRAPHLQKEGDNAGHKQYQLHQPFTKNGLLAAGPLKFKGFKKSTGQGSSMDILDSIHPSGSKSPMTRSISTSFSIKPKNSESSILRRYPRLGLSLGATAKAPSWTRFPSHTRSQRTGSAGQSDTIQVRDFSPLTEASVSSIADQSTTTSTAAPPPPLVMARSKTRFPGGRKSRSMTFSKNTAKRVWKHWVRVYRSQSSDLRRLRTGHRSSISQGVGRVEYPELEIIPGFFGTAPKLDGSIDASDVQVPPPSPAACPSDRSFDATGRSASRLQIPPAGGPSSSSRLQQHPHGIATMSQTTPQHRADDFDSSLSYFTAHSHSRQSRSRSVSVADETMLRAKPSSESMIERRRRRKGKWKAAEHDGEKMTVDLDQKEADIDDDDDDDEEEEEEQVSGRHMSDTHEGDTYVDMSVRSSPSPPMSERDGRGRHFLSQMDTGPYRYSRDEGRSTRADGMEMAKHGYGYGKEVMDDEQRSKERLMGLLNGGAGEERHGYEGGGKGEERSRE